MVERREEEVKAGRLMRLLARPPATERDGSSEELKWNIERRRALEKHRREVRRQWYEFHRRLQEHHEKLADDHRQEALALEPSEEAGEVNGEDA